MFFSFVRWLRELSTGLRRVSRPRSRKAPRQFHFYRLTLEQLEDRLAPATLTWTGNGGLANQNWDNSLNWTTNTPGHIIPAAGDSLVFGTGVTQKSSTDNISGLSLKSITFKDSGYSIAGGGGVSTLTLTGGIAANTGVIKGDDTILLNIALTANETFSISGSTVIHVTGALSDGSSLTLTKAGTGKLDLSGDNTPYAGVIRVSAGVLDVQ